MTDAQDIRDHIEAKYIQNARDMGLFSVDVTSGVVGKELHLGNMANVCQVMRGRMLESQTNVITKVVASPKMRDGATLVCRYSWNLTTGITQLYKEAEKIIDTIGEPTWGKLRECVPTLKYISQKRSICGCSKDFRDRLAKQMMAMNALDTYLDMLRYKEDPDVHREEEVLAYLDIITEKLLEPAVTAPVPPVEFESKGEI